MTRHSTSGRPWVLESITERDEAALSHLVDITSSPLSEAGAYTRPLFGSTEALSVG